GPFSALARLIRPPPPASRRLDQTASCPCSISSFVRPVLTDVSKCWISKLGSAASSFFLISSHSLSDRVRTRAYRPVSRTPLSRMAQCFCTTKRFPPLASGAPFGSEVLLKSRFRWYSLSERGIEFSLTE